MMRHHPIVYAFEEPSSSSSSSCSSNYYHVAGINDIVPSFRINNSKNKDFHFLSAGRDGKLLEWNMMNKNNNNKATLAENTVPLSVVGRGAVSSFKAHADWVNCILPIPGRGFVSGGADNILRITTVCPVATNNNNNNNNKNALNSKSLNVVNKNNNNTQPTTPGNNENDQKEEDQEYTTQYSESFKHHSGTIRTMSWLTHFDHNYNNTNSSSDKTYSYDRLAMCSSDGSVSTLQIRKDDGSQAVTHKVLTGYTGNKSMPVCLAPGTNPTSTFYVGAANGVVHSVDIRSKALNVNEVIEEAHGGSSVVRDMLFYEHKNILVTAGSDSLIRLWDMRHVMDPLVSIDAHGDAVWKLQKYFAPSSTSSNHHHHFNRKNRFYFDNNTNASNDDFDFNTHHLNPNNLCFLSAGREGTVQLHSIGTTGSSSGKGTNNNTASSASTNIMNTNSSSSSLSYKTCILAQTSHPVISFLHHQTEDYNRLLVGTCTSDILEFDLARNPNKKNQEGDDGDDDDDSDFDLSNTNNHRASSNKGGRNSLTTPNSKSTRNMSSNNNNNNMMKQSGGGGGGNIVSDVSPSGIDVDVVLPNQTPDVSLENSMAVAQNITNNNNNTKMTSNNNNNANQQQQQSRRQSFGGSKLLLNNNNNNNPYNIGILANFIQLQESGEEIEEEEEDEDFDVENDEETLSDDDEENENNNNKANTANAMNVQLLSPFKPPRTEGRSSPKWATPVVVSSSQQNLLLTSDQRPPIFPVPVGTYRGGIGFIQSTTFPTRMHVAALQTNGEISVYDYIKCKKVATFSPAVRFEEDVVAVLEMLPGICPNWCQVGCNWGCITVTMSESDSNGSWLNGWELESGALMYMKKLMEDIEAKAAKRNSSSSSTNNHNRTTSTSSNTFGSSSSGALKLYFDPPSQSQHSLEDLRALRTPRNVVTWAFQLGIVPAAKKNRISKFIIKNLSCHITDDDHRSQFELPVEQIVFCENFVINMIRKREFDELQQQQKSSGGGGGQSSSHTSSNQQQQQQQPHYLPAPSSAVPRWLLVLAERKITSKDPSSQTVSFTCEPHPNPPPGFKKLGPAFETKDKDKNRPPSISFPRSALLSDLCALIHKNLRKSSSSSLSAPGALLCPTFASIQEARNTTGSKNNSSCSVLRPLHSEGLMKVQQQSNDNNNSTNSTIVTFDRSTFFSSPNSSSSNGKIPTINDKDLPSAAFACSEEFIVLFNGYTNTVIDPSLLLCSSNAIFREGRAGFNIKYAAIVGSSNNAGGGSS